ncbi:DNA translocase FtsK [Phaeovulum sp.]|uniref:DNA translocase FtsK n=1 Tax=Phaeovulum sp. TaxID=2934796 RepID=UPI00272EF3FD|nr:DNA translocase FtsK 4TM domain-containing protein [Phaeovulum sp.]MDP1668921.1 DNA translocase FtsK 4TM domain-containing protein [Phaeovulum sp.]MDZ4119192.1 DNA translocase FtsK 4TM domain-containing protein [Phaeovulum sp.]
MASYQARRRDPLLDEGTQAMIERRGKELLGTVLVGLGVLVALMLGSYSPADPGWMAATEAPVQNLLGRAGAAIASPVFVIVGHGAWGLAVALVVWGLRFAAHVGEDRALSRAIFVPIGVALAAVYAATLVPGDGWVHAFGLGGLFGDTVIGALLNLSPIDSSLGLKLLTLLVALATAVAASFVLGVDRIEARGFARLVLVGMVLLYAALMAMLGRGASASLRAAQNARARARERRAEAAERAAELAAWQEQEAGWHAAPPLAAPERSHAVPRIRRSAEAESLAEPVAELVETAPRWGDAAPDAPTEDRIRSRIADAVRARAAAGAATPVPTQATPPQVAQTAAPASVLSAVAARLTRAAKPGPEASARVEPPLRAAAPRFMHAVPLNPVPEVAVAFVEADDEWPPVADDPAPFLLTRPLAGAPDPRRVVQHAPRKPAAASRQAQAEAQPRLLLEAEAQAYEPPPLNLLTNPVHIQRHSLSDEALEENARMLENVLDDYGVKGDIVSVRPGPVVTMYELEPAPGLKASRVIGLADDIARSMSALSARVSTVPGRSVIGIELPNAHREKVVLREILSDRGFGDSLMKLPLALGKDIFGEPVIASLAKMPHLLIAGTTGSGKSVAINTMILSLVYKLSPQDCRLIMIDPKMLELSVYDGIPHLLSPVVTDPKKAVVALKWVVGEMEERYRKMSKTGVRNIEGYNGRVREALDKGEMFRRTVQTGFDEDTGEPIFETEEFAPQTLPYIVVVVDEMADLMMVAGKEIEACIQRLAQMARASGIHLIMATQRPSVDVITGTIKANFPTRISFQVTSKIDSRTILGDQGAEQLLGMGDMLYMAGGGRITRVHGPFVSDEEVEEIVNHLKSFGPPVYLSGVVEGPDDDREADIDAVLGLGGGDDVENALYDTAVAIVIKDRKCSTSYIQRKLGVGYNKAAKLVEQMEEQGVVSMANHVGKREILVPEQ